MFKKLHKQKLTPAQMSFICNMAEPFIITFDTNDLQWIFPAFYGAYHPCVCGVYLSVCLHKTTKNYLAEIGVN